MNIVSLKSIIKGFIAFLGALVTVWTLVGFYFDESQRQYVSKFICLFRDCSLDHARISQFVLKQSANNRADIELNLSLTKDAYVDCYYLDDRQLIYRIYPSQYDPEHKVTAQHELIIPSKASAEYIAFRPTRQNTVVKFACISMDEPVGERLPMWLRKQPYKRIDVPSLTNIAKAYKAVSEGQLDVKMISYRVK